MYSYLIVNRCIKTLFSAKGLVFLLVAAIAVFFRVIAISDRPFHHDEGVNYFFVLKVLNSGYYPYTHENYHGPSYFYLVSMIHYLFGTSEFTHRLASIIPGVLFCLLPFCLVRTLSFEARVLSSLLMSLSCSAVYHARYSIHESFLLLATLGLVFSTIAWIIFRDRKLLLWMGVSLGFLIATKETFIIAVAALGGAAVLTFGFNTFFSMLDRHRKYVLSAFAIAFFVIVVNFSGLFQSAAGIRELFFGVPQWVGRGHGDTGHHKIWWYYFRLLYVKEPVVYLACAPLLVLIWRLLKNYTYLFKKKGIFNTIYALYDRGFSGLLRNADEKFFVCMTFYTLLTIGAYSYVPYKTPWLIINMSVPAAIAAAGGLLMVLRERTILYSISAVACVVSCFYMLKFNFTTLPNKALSDFVKPVGTTSDSNLFAYVHSREGLRDFAKDVTEYVREGDGTKIYVNLESYWPMPFYLREFETHVEYLHKTDPSKYFKSHDILVVEKRRLPLSPSEWSMKRYNLVDHNYANVYFRLQ